MYAIRSYYAAIPSPSGSSIERASSPTMMRGNYSPKGKALKVLTKVAQFLGKRTFKNYKNILFLEKTARNNWPVKTIDFYKKQLEEIQPTSIFITRKETVEPFTNFFVGRA